MEIRELTKAEEEIMQVLWTLQKAFVKDIIDELSEPKPAYNTVSTIVRILEQKGFIAHNAFGKTHQYFPAISKEDYRRFVTDKLMTGYFGSSPRAMLSFFMQEQQIGINEADELLKLIEQMKKGTGN